MSAAAYPEYKDCGISWLGSLPSHWRLKQLKHVAAVIPSNVDKHSKDGELSVSLCNYTDVYYRERITEEIDFMRATASWSEIHRFRLLADDVVVTKDSETADDIGVPSYVPDTLPGVICGYHLSIIRPTEHATGRFLKYVLLSDPTRHYFEISAKGLTRVGLSQDALGNTPVPTPPRHEQEIIADFLDHETARIDALIEEQQRLIDLLREKQQAVIGQAVSRGLDATTPLEESGVSDIGKIPCHWNLKRLWHLTPTHRQIMYGIVLPGPHFEGGIPIVKGGDVAEHRLKLNCLSRTDPEIERKYERSRLRTGDLVYSIRGSIGEAAKISAELDGANLTQDAARIAYTDSTDGDWLLFALQADPVFRQLESKAVGATIRGINIRDLKRALIPTPPLHEQKEIASFLRNRLSEFKRLEHEAKRAISLMTEHRSSLIASAVTGRIDVREWERATRSKDEVLARVAEKEGRYG